MKIVMDDGLASVILFGDEEDSVKIVMDDGLASVILFGDEEDEEAQPA